MNNRTPKVFLVRTKRKSGNGVMPKLLPSLPAEVLTKAGTA